MFWILTLLNMKYCLGSPFTSNVVLTLLPTGYCAFLESIFCRSFLRGLTVANVVCIYWNKCPEKLIYLYQQKKKKRSHLSPVFSVEIVSVAFPPTKTNWLKTWLKPHLWNQSKQMSSQLKSSNETGTKISIIWKK